MYTFTNSKGAAKMIETIMVILGGVLIVGVFIYVHWDERKKK
jgi:hypothetical protein